MVVATAAANVLLGLLYVGFGLLTIAELRRSWDALGPSHFAMAWAAIFLTCGPHHLDHGIHVLIDDAAGSADLVTVLFGILPGATFLTLRTEALRGGRGDRQVSEGIGAVVVPLFLTALVGILVTNLSLALSSGVSIGAALLPNVALMVLYIGIAIVAGTTQVHNRAQSGTWSLSGVALTGVFVTCAAMHAAWILYVSQGVYEVHGHLQVVDLLGIPGAAYFLWVVHGLSTGRLTDWNATAAQSERVADAALDPRASLVEV